MSSSGVTLRESHKKFRADVTLRDPLSTDTYDFPCVIDTGCPDAIALPVDHADKFQRQLPDVERGGAGIGTSQAFAVEIMDIGSLDISEVVMGVMSLPSGTPVGLVGMDILRFLIVCLYDEPDRKRLDMDDFYLD